MFRKRPTAEELERARRQFLVQSGRLVDGMLLDICEVAAEDGRTLTMLLFSYRIGGVDYECSQDITACAAWWTGTGASRISLHGSLSAGQSAKQHRRGRRVDRTARQGLPQCCPIFRGSRPIDMSHLRPGLGVTIRTEHRASDQIRSFAVIPNPGYTNLMHLHAAPAGPGRKPDKTVLRISLAATLAYVVVTFVAGLRAHSLALLSEAGHNVSDFLALLLSFAAVYFQTRPADHSRTFGYQRAGVLAAFINAGYAHRHLAVDRVEAVHRLSSPVAVQPRIMMIVAAAGVAMNGAIAALLWGVARDVNMRSAFLHMAGDTLSTAAVIAGGAGILLTGRTGSTRCSRCSLPR